MTQAFTFTTSDLLKMRFELTEKLIRMDQINPANHRLDQMTLALNDYLTVEEIRLFLQNNPGELTEAEYRLDNMDGNFVYTPLSNDATHPCTIYLVRNNNNLMIIPFIPL